MKSKQCPTCKSNLIRIDFVDCLACQQCDIWIEKGCCPVAEGCQFCLDLAKYKKPSDIPLEQWDNKFNVQY